MRLRVLSLNVWGLPAPVGRDVAPRVERINARLPSFDADLVFYQEVWTNAARDQLVAGGARAGFQHVWHLPRARGGSGLLALSRQPIRDVAFAPYSLCGLPQRVTHADYYGGKGFVRLGVDVEGVPVTLFNTHMHARYAPADVIDEYIGHRAGEVIELSRAVRSTASPVIAVGDYNLSEDSAEYRTLRGLTGLTDVAVALDARQNTATLSNPYRLRKRAKNESRIDYVFCRAGERHGVSPVKIERVLDEIFDLDGLPATYSDHAGLLGEIQLSPHGEPRRPATASAIDEARALLEHGRTLARERRTFERTSAGGGILATGVAARFSSTARVKRRTLLRLALATGAGFAATSALGAAALSEHFVAEELAAFDAAEAELDAIAGARTTHARASDGRVAVTPGRAVR